MGSSTQEDYNAFEEKVRRTIYLDNLSPQVTESVIRTALDQFATVKNVQFIPNYTEARNMPQTALVELESAKQAGNIVAVITEFPFMMSGMPRPVRAGRAKIEMFDNHPIKPGRTIKCRWLDPTDPDFEVATTMKHLIQKHEAEAKFLLKQQLEEEETLAKQQEQTLKANYKKHEMIASVTSDGTVQELARRYSMRVAND